MSDWFQPVPLFDGEDVQTLKTAFARLWAKYPNRMPADIGCEVFREMHEPLRGLQAGAVWSRDLDVLEMRDRFKTFGATELKDEFKEELGRNAIRRLMTLIESPDEKIALDAVKEATEIAGYKPKGAGVIVNNDNRIVSVLRVPTRDVSDADNADFDVKFKRQQTQLVADARSRAN